MLSSVRGQNFICLFNIHWSTDPRITSVFYNNEHYEGTEKVFLGRKITLYLNLWLFIRLYPLVVSLN